jgi:hypothetical protein
MIGLTTALLSQACRIFFNLAYPAGEQSIPEKKRPYLHISPDAPLTTFLPPASAAHGLCQVLRADDGSLRGYAFRLGSAHFPHLKLQVTNHEHGAACVFQVDTHDAFPRTGTPPEDHPEFKQWTALQKANRQMKDQIERAWENEGLWTFPKLLRESFDSAPGPCLPGGDS